MGLGSTGKPLNFTGKPPARSNQSRNGLYHNVPAVSRAETACIIMSPPGNSRSYESINCRIFRIGFLRHPYIRDYLRYLIFILTRKACNASVTPFASIIGQECR